MTVQELMLIGICGANRDHHIKDFPPINLLVGTFLQTIKISFFSHNV